MPRGGGSGINRDESKCLSRSDNLSGLRLPFLGDNTFYNSLVGSLGFYYDDYSELAQIDLADDHSIIALLMEQIRLSPLRPVEAIYLVLAYSVFGLNPLGHHILAS